MLKAGLSPSLSLYCVSAKALAPKPRGDVRDGNVLFIGAIDVDGSLVLNSRKARPSAC